MRAAALALALLAAACAPKPQPYAPVKKRLCTDCWTAKLPFNVPEHGFALGRGGVFLTEAPWWVVDLDRGVENAITTRFDRQSNTVNLLSRKETPLDPARRKALVETANAIWASDLALDTERIPDVVWDLYLFDGKDVRHEYGPGQPVGLAARLEDQVQP